MIERRRYEESNSAACDTQTKLVRMILDHFRWLDHVTDSAQMTASLLECMQVCPLGAKTEIIGLLPDLTTDAEQGAVAQQLKELMDCDPTLTVPVLDALSNMMLPKDVLDDVLDAASRLLPSTDVSRLPVVIRFLVQGSGIDGMRASRVVDGKFVRQQRWHARAVFRGSR